MKYKTEKVDIEIVDNETEETTVETFIIRELPTSVSIKISSWGGKITEEIDDMPIQVVVTLFNEVARISGNREISLKKN